MKQQYSKTSKLKKSTFSTFKRIFLQSKKRMTISVLAVVAVAGLLGFGSYQSLNSISKANADLKSEADKKQASKKAVEKTVVSIAPVAKAPATTDEAEEAKPAVNNGGVMSKKGCYAGCVTASPKFSISTLGSVTVTQGTNAGPFTASTSNGYAVDWNTPGAIGYEYIGPGLAPYGFSTGTIASLKGSSMQYMIRAEKSVPPGSYSMLIRATHGPSETIVQTTFTVIVVAAPADSPAPVTN